MTLIKAAAELKNLGACTALIAALDDTRSKLHVTTVGDSGVRILRRNMMRSESSSGVHSAAFFLPAGTDCDRPAGPSELELPPAAAVVVETSIELAGGGGGSPSAVPVFAAASPPFGTVVSTFAAVVTGEYFANEACTAGS